jgi:GNAT superfamily N-acetyltransferase
MPDTPAEYDALEVVQVSPRDERARVLLDDLEREYDERYGDLVEGSAADEMSSYPAERFLPPDGAFVLLLQDGHAIAGGAFMRFDDATAEFKRIWTHPDHRRRGLSRRVLVELENEAARRGYARVFLTTGPRQPEAQSLYRATGYTVLPLVALEDGLQVHPFEKALPVAG